MALGNNLKKSVKENKRTFERSNDVVLPATSIPDWEKESTDDLDDGLGATELMCVFRSGTTRYAIPIKLSKEVVKMRQLAPIPQMPKHIIGMANVRGSIYGVLDLSIFFGNVKTVDESGEYLLVLNDDKFKICISIPSVPDTLYVRDSMKEDINSSMLKSIKKKEFLKGVIKKDDELIIQLNISDLISDPCLVNESEQSANGQK